MIPTGELTKQVGVLRWWTQMLKRAIAALAAVVLALLVLVVIEFTHIQNTADKQAKDERAACVIQANGLPAGHALASVIGDLHKLLILPPSPQARKQPPLKPSTKALIEDLNHQAQLYAQLEAAQPPTRTC